MGALLTCLVVTGAALALGAGWLWQRRGFWWRYRALCVGSYRLGRKWLKYVDELPEHAPEDKLPV